MGFTVRAEVEIAAPPAEVWRVLTDFGRYPDWNPFTVHIRSSLELGSPVDMKVALWTGMKAQREFIREVVPGRRVDWGTCMGPCWLLRGERRQWLEALPGGRTRYVTDDQVSGVLSPVVRALYGRGLQRGLAAMAEALRARCEAHSEEA